MPDSAGLRIAAPPSCGDHRQRGSALSLTAIPLHYGLSAPASATVSVAVSAAVVLAVAVAGLLAGAVIPPVQLF